MRNNILSFCISLYINSLNYRCYIGVLEFAMYSLPGIRYYSFHLHVHHWLIVRASRWSACSISNSILVVSFGWPCSAPAIWGRRHHGRLQCWWLIIGLDGDTLRFTWRPAFHATGQCSCTHNPSHFIRLAPAWSPQSTITAQACPWPMSTSIIWRHVVSCCTRSQHASICQANHHTWTARQWRKIGRFNAKQEALAVVHTPPMR